MEYEPQYIRIPNTDGILDPDSLPEKFWHDMLSEKCFTHEHKNVTITVEKDIVEIDLWTSVISVCFPISRDVLRDCARKFLENA